MDLNSIKDQVSNLTLYDLKAGVRKVQNGESAPGWNYAGRAEADRGIAVMNYTEMEAKVRPGPTTGRGIHSMTSSGQRSYE